MTTKLKFRRHPNGEFSEPDLIRAAVKLRNARGASARVPLEFKAAATQLLIAATWKVFEANNENLRFDECAKRAVRANPHLAFLDRLDPLEPGARDLDVEIEEAEA
jgi:hypothetical protein